MNHMVNADEKSTLVRRQEEDKLALDVANRSLAVDVTRSCIVQAPAGAGKTELLTQRYLGLLATVESPEQIVAITFTRKAAAEMRERILKRLAAWQDAEPPTEHERQSWRLANAAMRVDAEQGWKLLDNPERLRLLTIDSLCASLVRQMPYLSRFGGMPAIAEKPQVHYAEAARQTVAAVEDYPAVADALAYLDNNAGKLQRLIETMLTARDQWLPFLADLRSGDAVSRQALLQKLQGSLERLIRRDLDRAARVLAALQTPELIAAGQFVSAYCPTFAVLADWLTPLGDDVSELPRWRALGGLLLTGKGEPRKSTHGLDLPTDKAEPSSKVHKAALKSAWETLAHDGEALDALCQCLRCPDTGYTEAGVIAIETFADVLLLATGLLQTVFQEAGEIDFTGIAQGALQALGEDDAPTDLALRLDYAVRHLLVDEFQDTNIQQIELLKRLTAGWEAGDGRTLFVVGDPMQSIYRFRKADVGLFLGAWQRGIGVLPLEPLQLFRNNRSFRNVMTWINDNFQKIFPKHADAELGRVLYAEATPTKDADAGQENGVFVRPIVVETTREAQDEDATDLIEDGDDLEAKEMLAIIESTWADDPKREIAILVRARSHLKTLVTEIRRAHPQLRYEAVEIETLAARQPIQDLLALTRALMHRADRVNWLAILRAPWCGLTLADLHALAHPNGEKDLPTVWSLMHDAARIARMSTDGQARLKHAVSALTDFVEHAGRTIWRRRVEAAWLRLGGHLCIGSTADAEDVRTYFALLDKLDAAGDCDADQLGEQVEELFAAPNTDPLAHRLKFMTIHKSKGLEFDTVILPGLHRRGAKDGEKLLTWESTHEDGGHLVVTPLPQPDIGIPVADPADEGDDLRAYVRSFETARATQENLRLLYVAATRAIRALYLLGVTKVKREGKTGKLKKEQDEGASGSLLNLLWPVVGEDFRATLEAKLSVTATGETVAAQGSSPCYERFVPQLQRLPLAALPSHILRPAPSGMVEVEDEKQGLHYRTASNLTPHIGTLVHRMLELIARQGLVGWDGTRIMGMQPALAKWLAQQGHDDQAARKGSLRVVEALQRALSSERGRWILKPRPEAACELALTQWQDGALRNHVIDRTFVDDGVRWIIDYKTSAHEGSDVEGFIATKLAEYAPQLERYAALFPGETVRQALFFVEMDRFEEL